MWLFVIERYYVARSKAFKYLDFSLSLSLSFSLSLSLLNSTVHVGDSFLKGENFGVVFSLSYSVTPNWSIYLPLQKKSRYSINVLCRLHDLKIMSCFIMQKSRFHFIRNLRLNAYIVFVNKYSRKFTNITLGEAYEKYLWNFLNVLFK